MLSIRFKEAFKVALAMTIAYGIALSMDWEKPYWAGFAVAFVSLATIGQSLNKAAMRMLGTLLAVVVALTIIAIAPQSRWLFMVLLSLWVGLCTYLMGGTKRQYFWNVGGFVSVIVALDAGPDSANAFDIAILRAQETGLGILVYSLVAVLLWPSNSGKDFLAAVGNLASTQHQLFTAYLGLMGGQGDAEKGRALRGQEVQVQDPLDYPFLFIREVGHIVRVDVGYLALFQIVRWDNVICRDLAGIQGLLGLNFSGIRQQNRRHVFGDGLDQTCLVDETFGIEFGLGR